MTLETLMTGCIDRAEAQGADGVEAFLADHPEHAGELRQLLGSLQGMGLIEEPDGEDETQVLGDFRLLSRLGEGGMGVVWLAGQISVERFVALKVIHPTLATSPTARKRFRQEARAIAALRHPSVVTVLAAGEEKGQLWLAMEYIDGVDLNECLGSSHDDPDLRTLVSWTAQVARGLGAVHAAGFVHRDVKPSNIRIDTARRAMLVDFGLARDVEGGGTTLGGSFLGTPVYASPEQLEGSSSEMGPASDVYSLGATLYEALAGRPPFAGDSTHSILRSMRAVPLTSIRRVAPGIPRDLETIVTKALEVDPRRRYTDGDAMAADLEAFLAFEPIAARPPGTVQRAKRWVRTHRLLATTLAILFAGLLIASLATLWEKQSARAERAEQASDLLTLARSTLAWQQARSAQELRFEQAVANRERSLLEERAPDSAWWELDRDEARVATQRESRAELFARVQRSLDQAERLVPQAPGLRELRASLHVEQLRFARATGSTSEAHFHEQRARSADVAGQYDDFLAKRSSVGLTTNPAGAVVSLYRYHEARALGASGGARLIAVPWKGQPKNIEAGTTVLRVVEPTGELEAGDPLLEIAGHPIRDAVLVDKGNDFVQRGDRLVAIDGVPVRRELETRGLASSRGPHELLFSHFGEEYLLDSTEALGVAYDDAVRVASRGGLEALVWRDGSVFETILAEGIVLRPTASPLLPCEEAHWGHSPLEFTSLEAGSYVALLRAPGHADTRIPFDVEYGVQLELNLVLPESASPGPDWVPVVSATNPGAPTFWAQDHEVTCSEYLEFLNQPAVLAQIFESGAPPLRYPRDTSTLESGSFFRMAGGVFHLGLNDRADTPVYGIHAADAEAYAAWLSRRAAERGEPWSFALPTLEQHTAMREVSSHRRYVTGARFRPHSIQSGPAKSELRLEPAFSYPLDEGPRGLYDLAGGVAEWLATPFDRSSGRRWLAGGSWSQRQPMQFELNYRYVSGEVGCYGTQGFRLVARRR